MANLAEAPEPSLTQALLVVTKSIEHSTAVQDTRMEYMKIHDFCTEAQHQDRMFWKSHPFVFVLHRICRGSSQVSLGLTGVARVWPNNFSLDCKQQKDLCHERCCSCVKTYLCTRELLLDVFYLT